MHYFSTNRRSPDVSFREAVLLGQPGDRGLFFPSEIPRFSGQFLADLPALGNDEIAFEVIRPYVGGEIPDPVLRRLCAETVDFEFPLVPLGDRISVLELFHGPTLAFKDVGARFMSRCLRQFADHATGKTIVIVATSGDTGGAVASGFHNVEGVEVVILYPKGKVSRVQELQLTTLDGNVTALELNGDFDDCQALAKQALGDAELQSRVNLTSANSINVARWLPQQFYYCFAMKHWDGEPPVMCVPSGNFGNLAAGMLAFASGLPVEKFLAACNANDVVPRYLANSVYEPRDSVATLSNAMDVADPSNFVRIIAVCEQMNVDLLTVLEAESVSDEETAETMLSVREQYDYVLDPHGAVAYKMLADYLGRNGGTRGIMLETAHPIKFDSVNDILGEMPGTPEPVAEMFAKEKRSVEVEADYDQLREILLSKI